MSDNLTGDDLAALVQRVFEPRPDDRTLAILIDLPDEEAADHPAWAVSERPTRMATSGSDGTTMWP